MTTTECMPPAPVARKTASQTAIRLWKTRGHRAADVRHKSELLEMISAR
jgi:hypothetical protein